MEALRKALDPRFDSNTIPDFLDFFGFWSPQKNINPKNLGWCLSQIEGLGPSGVLPLNASRRVSMSKESFSPYSPILVPIMKHWFQKSVPDPILGVDPPPTLSTGGLGTMETTGNIRNIKDMRNTV